jgi:hypothetical protein
MSFSKETNCLDWIASNCLVKLYSHFNVNTKYCIIRCRTTNCMFCWKINVIKWMSFFIVRWFFTSKTSKIYILSQIKWLIIWFLITLFVCRLQEWSILHGSCNCYFNYYITYNILSPPTPTTLSYLNKTSKDYFPFDILCNS